MAEERDPTQMTSHDGPRSSTFVVGLGASAGGIKALKNFFAHVESGDNIAYAVILHLSPDHDSRLAEVLQTAAPLPVSQVNSDAPIVPGHVYVIPPNKSLTIDDGKFVVADITRREQRQSPVDVFFRALADNHGSRSASARKNTSTGD